MNATLIGRRRTSPKSRSERTILASLFTVAALLLASCASGSEATNDAPEAAQNSSSVLDSGRATPSGAFPDFEVVNVSEGTEVKFSDVLENGTTPVLMWFYAPH